MRAPAQRVVLIALLCLCTRTQAQQPDLPGYIHDSWDKLSRSMTDCASVADPKLTTAPVLYLPAEEKMPASVKAMQAQCKVDVRRLPKEIHKEGDLSPDDIGTPGLLYLPNRYVVPGGRFNEMYGWDSYFILLGEIADGRIELARGTVENFFYEIDHYGAVLNANRTYFLTRSQPPFLSSMVLEVYRADLAAHPGDKDAERQANKWLKTALPYLVRDHALWTAAPHLAGTTGLARYADLGHGPVPEMADDSTYYLDVLRWLRDHPKLANPAYTEAAGASATGRHCAAKDQTTCLKTELDGRELTEAFFAGDRAMRESGFDTTFRFGAFSGSTTDYAPVCLNALLYKYERDLAYVEARVGDKGAAVQWSSLAGDRLARMQVMWDADAGLFLDYDFVHHRRSGYPYVTAFYTMWAHVATPEQAKLLVAKLPVFERAGGLEMSPVVTGVQWDAPYGWAPCNWLAVAGLDRYGFHDEARRVAGEFSATVEHGFAADGTVREKYNVVQANADVAVTSGYKQNVIGFGWTNGVYLKMQALLHAAAPAEAEPSTR